MPFMLAFSYTVAFLCKRMYRVQHQFHFQFFSVDYQQFTLQSTNLELGYCRILHYATKHLRIQWINLNTKRPSGRAGERAAAIY